MANVAVAWRQPIGSHGRLRASIRQDGKAPRVRANVPGVSHEAGKALLAVKETEGRCDLPAVTRRTRGPGPDWMRSVLWRAGTGDFGGHVVVTRGGQVSDREPVSVWN